MSHTSAPGPQRHDAVRRLQRFNRYGPVAVIALLAVAAPICLFVLGLPVAMSFVFVMLLIPLGIWSVVKLRPLTRADFLLCTTCGYSLQGRSDRGVCPECGGAYVHAEVRQRWLAAMSGRAKEKTFGADDGRIDET